jgi:hypothetical protein
MARKKADSTEISIPDVQPRAEADIPRQTEFYKLPTRFGAVPIDEAPLGWEVETRRRETKVTKFEHAYPRIYLPFREVQRVEFGHNHSPSFPLEDEAYREHIITRHKDYSELLSFIQPPEVRIAHERIGKWKYRFDVSESVSLNKDGVIANVQGTLTTAVASVPPRASPSCVIRKPASPYLWWSTSSRVPAKRRLPAPCRTIRAAKGRW